MKKLSSLILICLIGVSVLGQDTNVIRKTGSVGIGTLSPTVELDVRGIINSEKFQISPPSSGSWFNIFSANGSNRLDFNRVLNGDIPLMSILTNGNVGIGKTTPSSKLEVRAEAEDRSILTIGSNVISQSIGRKLSIELRDKDSDSYPNKLDRVIRFGSITEGSWGDNKSFFIETNGQQRFKIRYDGNVGIGTTTPDYKLDVCGTIRAKELKVEEFTCSNASFNGTLASNQITVTTNGQTADLVFEEDYELRDLQEVEYFIQTNKHLPDIPSAAAMEENGVNLAEMNKLLLQKVEELTLYTIQKEKEVQELKEKGERQEEKVSSLKSQVTSLEEARRAEFVDREKLEAEVKNLKEVHKNTVETLEERLAKIEALLISK